MNREVILVLYIVRNIGCLSVLHRGMHVCLLVDSAGCLVQKIC
jgi:hypothetical protein